MKIKRALISVSDKTGIDGFAKGLADLGVEIVSTGGTAKYLREKGVAVKDVSEVTHFPEMMGGRLKTIHPVILGGILARRDEPSDMQSIEEHGLCRIDLVAVNLYPFEKTVARAGVTFEEAIENIDIGGPTMVRAAAKNFHDVAVVVNPEDYDGILKELAGTGDLSFETRKTLMIKAFRHTSQYDGAIASHFGKREGGLQ
ncbi:MAG: bifunctional phosphoribosylaminoimidazolecarboxamide formyltransferase/IMP cyclohydrolase, partial [Deltaproteobacteria bacterium]|nr:bifunctional phosphoribosylaminoimidazolecarboxamide formyltransferase/IMP cyclohydrolase [Deltaproteobacteria bacterium]